MTCYVKNRFDVARGENSERFFFRNYQKPICFSPEFGQKIFSYGLSKFLENFAVDEIRNGPIPDKKSTYRWNEFPFVNYYNKKYSQNHFQMRPETNQTWSIEVFGDNPSISRFRFNYSTYKCNSNQRNQNRCWL